MTDIILLVIAIVVGIALGIGKADLENREEAEKERNRCD